MKLAYTGRGADPLPTLRKSSHGGTTANATTGSHGPAATAINTNALPNIALSWTTACAAFDVLGSPVWAVVAITQPPRKSVSSGRRRSPRTARALNHRIPKQSRNPRHSRLPTPYLDWPRVRGRWFTSNSTTW